MFWDDGDRAAREATVAAEAGPLGARCDDTFDASSHAPAMTEHEIAAMVKYVRGKHPGATARPRCVASERGMSLNLRTPTREAPSPFSLDLRGATASGLVPFSGAVACWERGEMGWMVRRCGGERRLSAAAREFSGRRLASSGVP